jgi:hypothetical protein
MSNGKLNVLQPVMQYGFAGVTAVLLGIVVWMVDRSDRKFDQMLAMQQQTNQVIERNTAAIVKLGELVCHIER